MRPCPACKADAAKLRLGTLGEIQGVWCTDCGHKTPTVAAWEDRPPQGRIIREDLATWPTIEIASGVKGLTLDQTAVYLGAPPRYPGETDIQLTQRLADFMRKNGI